MIVLGIRSVEAYFEDHAGHQGIKAARMQYDAWLSIVRQAEWHNPDDVKRAHPKASILKGGRAVFNIKGNDYRMVVALNYVAGVAMIRFFGTHAEYDEINAEWCDECNPGRDRQRCRACSRA